MSLRSTLQTPTPLWATILTAIIPTIGVIVAAIFAKEGSISATQIRADTDFQIAELNDGIQSIQLEIQQQNAVLERDKFTFESEIEKLRTDLLVQDSSLEQQRFEAEQRYRREEAAKKFIPMLFSTSEADVDIALAVLFVLYPNEAEGMLRSVAESQSDESKHALQPAIERAESVDDLVGEWIVVVANTETLEDALAFSQVPKDKNYPTTIYTLESMYVVSAGPYSTLTDAESAQIGLRTNVSPGAYILNLNRSCPVRVAREDYIECRLSEY